MTEHPIFGKLKYKPDDERWVGFARLPLFADVGRMPDGEPMSPEEEAELARKLEEATKGLNKLMSDKFGEAGEKVVAALQRESEKAEQVAIDAAPDPREEAREKKRQERDQKERDRLARGQFPIRIADPNEEGPTPEQVASFELLQRDEARIAVVVREEIYTSFESAYSQEYWRQMAGLKPAANIDELAGQYAIRSVEFSREHRGGFAHLCFGLDSTWKDDHGLVIVYSPDTGKAEWTTYDGLYDILSEGNEGESDSDDDGSPPNPFEEKQEELMQALQELNAERAKQLVAEGATVEPVDDDDYPLLHMFVDECELDQVRLVLQLGADPNVTEDITDGKPRTPLYKCRQLARTMGLMPKKKKKNATADEDGLEEAMGGIMEQAMAQPQMQEMGQRLMEIIRLLEEAGGKVKVEE